MFVMGGGLPFSFPFHSVIMAESIISFGIPAGIEFFFAKGSVLVLFSAPFLAALSAVSFPSMPIWALTQAIAHLCVRQAMF